MKKEQPKFDCTVFPDRTHGKALSMLLRRVGFTVKSIHQVYPKKLHEKIGDPTWIAKCGENDWIAISGDKRLETNVENKQAVINAKCKLFILTDTNSLAEEWASAIIVGKDRFHALIRQNAGPFFASIGKQAHSHVGRLRFPQTAATKTKASVASD